jgi:hypothetical protein
MLNILFLFKNNTIYTSSFVIGLTTVRYSKLYLSRSVKHNFLPKFIHPLDLSDGIIITSLMQSNRYEYTILYSTKHKQT